MATRFADNGDGTVVDTKTGLTWQREPAPERMNWPEAQRFIQQLKISNVQSGGQEEGLPGTVHKISVSDESQNKHLFVLKHQENDVAYRLYQQFLELVELSHVILVQQYLYHL